jgi:uncharacterized protein (TIGR03790 family)
MGWLRGSRPVSSGLGRWLAAVLAPVLAGAAVLVVACGAGGGAADNTPTDRVPPPGPSLQAADLAVLVAQGDPTSEAIALAYQQARGIPEANMVRIPIATGSDAISQAAFDAIKTSIDARLPSAVQATLVTWTRPFRVQGASCSMGITSALAFGFDARYCGGCARTTQSPYFDSSSSKPFTDWGLRPSMMLGASSLAQAQALIARGVAADGSVRRRVNAGTAAANAWLVRTNDIPRSVRYEDFLALSQRATQRPVPGLDVRYVDSSASAQNNWVTDQNDVLLYLTGLATVPQIGSNRYLPGAVGDHLTSAGGVLSGTSQMPITDWLQAGLTASYGSVEEPCNYVEKFPRATVLVDRYAKGDTLIEAYWKSVLMPGQGLFVGEPLARPWGP